jgi:hypothetical protein
MVYGVGLGSYKSVRTAVFSMPRRRLRDRLRDRIPGFSGGGSSNSSSDSGSSDPFSDGSTGTETIRSGDSDRADSTGSSGSPSSDSDPEGSSSDSGSTDSGSTGVRDTASRVDEQTDQNSQQSDGPFEDGSTGSETLGAGGDESRARATADSDGTGGTTTPGDDRAPPQGGAGQTQTTAGGETSADDPDAVRVPEEFGGSDTDAREAIAKESDFDADQLDVVTNEDGTFVTIDETEFADPAARSPFGSVNPATARAVQDETPRVDETLSPFDDVGLNNPTVEALPEQVSEDNTTPTTAAAADDPGVAFDSPAPVGQYERFGDFTWGENDRIERGARNIQRDSNDFLRLNAELAVDPRIPVRGGEGIRGGVRAERTAIDLLGDFGLLEETPDRFVQNGEGPLERTAEAGSTGISEGLNPAQLPVAGIEIAEFAATQPSQVFDLDPSNLDSFEDGEFQDPVFREDPEGSAEFNRDVNAVAGSTAASAAESAQQDPAGFLGGAGGGLAAGFAAGAVGGSVVRRVSGGRFASGSDLSGTLLRGASRRVGFQQRQIPRDAPADAGPSGGAFDDLPDEVAGTSPRAEDIDTFRMEPDSDRVDAPEATRRREQERVEREAGERGPGDRSRDAAFRATQDRPGTVADRLEYDRSVPGDDLRRLDRLERTLVDTETPSFATGDATAAASVTGVDDFEVDSEEVEVTEAATGPVTSGGEAVDQQLSDESVSDFFGSDELTPTGEPREVADQQLSEESASSFFTDTTQTTDQRADIPADTAFGVDSRTDVRTDTGVDSRVDTRQDTRQDVRVDTRQDTRQDTRLDVRQDIRQDFRFDTRTDTESRQDIRFDLDPAPRSGSRSDFDPFGADQPDPDADVTGAFDLVQIDNPVQPVGSSLRGDQDQAPPNPFGFGEVAESDDDELDADFFSPF